MVATVVAEYFGFLSHRLPNLIKRKPLTQARDSGEIVLIYFHHAPLAWSHAGSVTALPGVFCF